MEEEIKKDPVDHCFAQNEDKLHEDQRRVSSFAHFSYRACLFVIKWSCVSLPLSLLLHCFCLQLASRSILWFGTEKVGSEAREQPDTGMWRTRSGGEAVRE